MIWTFVLLILQLMPSIHLMSHYTQYDKWSWFILHVVSKNCLQLCSVIVVITLEILGFVVKCVFLRVSDINAQLQNIASQSGSVLTYVVLQMCIRSCIELVAHDRGPWWLEAMFCYQKSDPVECGNYWAVKLLEHLVEVIECVFENKNCRKYDDMPVKETLWSSYSRPWPVM